MVGKNQTRLFFEHITLKRAKLSPLANKYIGGYNLREITPAIMQNFYDKLDDYEKENVEGFSETRFSLRHWKNTALTT